MNRLNFIQLVCKALQAHVRALLWPFQGLACALRAIKQGWRDGAQEAPKFEWGAWRWQRPAYATQTTRWWGEASRLYIAWSAILSKG